MKNRKVHIALFNTNLRDCSFGGAERVMLNLAQGFASLKLNVDLVLIQPGSFPFLGELPPEVRVVGLKWSHRGFLSLLALIPYLYREKPQALLSTLSVANVVAIWAKLLSGVATHITIREANTISRHIQPDNIRQRLILFLVRFSYSRADSIVAVSQGVATDMSRVLGLPLERIQVIYNPTVTPVILTKANATLEEPWFAPGQPPVILSVGRLYPQKDYTTLIRAFARLQQLRPAHLMILGEGTERLHLENLVRELGLTSEVSLPGFVTNPYAYIARAQVFVLSSIYEGLPNSLIEAIACGTPVVSTDCESGPREILGGGEYGRLVQVGDVESLAEAILATLENPIDSEVLQQRANLFSLERITNQYLESLNLNR